MHAYAPTCVAHVLVCVRVHLQTVGTHVLVHAEAWVRAANRSPQRTTPLCATPGCPQYLKTESVNRRRGDPGEGSDKEEGWEEEKEKSKQVTDGCTQMWDKSVRIENQL